MRESFKGWRRKAGCVALAISLAFAGAWIRSLMKVDRSDLDDWLKIVSTNGKLIVEQQFPWEIGVTGGNLARLVPHSADGGYEPMENKEVLWRYDLAGFHIGRGYRWGGRGSRALCNSCVVPYWMFAWPMSLLSAYLILWPGKRVTKQAVKD